MKLPSRCLSNSSASVARFEVSLDSGWVYFLWKTSSRLHATLNSFEVKIIKRLAIVELISFVAEQFINLLMLDGHSLLWENLDLVNFARLIYDFVLIWQFSDHFDSSRYESALSTTALWTFEWMLHKTVISHLSLARDQRLGGTLAERKSICRITHVIGLINCESENNLWGHLSRVAIVVNPSLFVITKFV